MRPRQVLLGSELGRRVDDELERLSIGFGSLVRIALSRYFEAERRAA